MSLSGIAYFRAPACKEGRGRSRLRPLAAGLIGGLVAFGAFPGASEAHGPVAPVASSYLARLSHVPPGLVARVVDGDQQMWLAVPKRETVVVLDYQGAPYLRFTASGVDVNENSAMYYLNQTPVAEVPPTNLSRTTPPRWQRVSGAHAYGWHDGRLHALAVVALSPGSSYVGRWSIPLVIDGRRSTISGGLWHSGAISIVWFWPILVVLACVLAALRVRRPELDSRVARVLALLALVATVTAAIGRELHGRPTVSVFQVVELGIVMAFVGWGFRRAVLTRAGYLTSFAIAFVAVWEGGNLIPTLLNGYVLIALPAFVARAATVLCLGSGVGLMLVAYRMSAPAGRPAASARPMAADSSVTGPSPTRPLARR
jgi:hypothetical protein